MCQLGATNSLERCVAARNVKARGNGGLERVKKDVKTIEGKVRGNFVRVGCCRKRVELDGEGGL